MTYSTYASRRALGQEFCDKLRTNYTKVRALGSEKLGMINATLDLKQASYTYLPQLNVTDLSRGITPYSICLQMQEGPLKDGINVFSTSGHRLTFLPFAWSSGEYTDALVLAAAMLDLVAATFRKEVSSGCVKAYFEPNHKLFWVSKRASSDKIAKYGNDYYIVENNAMFIQVTNLVTSAVRYIHVNEAASVRYYNNQYYDNEGFVSVYENSIPFDVVYTSLPETTAERQYETVVVDGETRYINVQKPGMQYFKKGIHSYSTRIEGVVEADKLFLKGVNDLYAKRETAETPFLGWELEACSNLSSFSAEETAIKFKEQLPYLVMCKVDGSIQPAGFETVSVPATLDAWKETDLTDALDVMRVKPYSMRSFEHSSTGFHVHVSRSALSVLDLQKLERFMHNPANRDFLSSIAGRGPVNYAAYNDKMFSDRKSQAEVSSSSNVFGRRIDHIFERDMAFFSEARNLTALDFNRHFGSVVGNSFTTRWKQFYSFCNNYVSFQSLAPALAVQDPVLYAELEELNRRYGYGNGFELWNYLNRYVAEQHPMLARVLVALADGRPTMAKIVQYYFPELDVPTPVIEPVIVPTSSDVPAWKTKVSTKAIASTSRKNSYSAARSIKGAVGKGAVRYDVLNTSNQSTVEFRLFKGTMNPSTVFRYLEFVDALVRFVATTSASDEGVNFKTFIKFLVDDTFNVSRYENLVTFLLSKKYIERISIKKRNLIDIGKADGDVNKIVTAKVLKMGGNREPLYNISTRAAADRSFVELPPIVDDFDDDDFDDDQDEDDGIDFDGGPDCQCSDCRATRNG